MDGFTSHILPAESAGASFDIEQLSSVIAKKSAETINKFKPLFNEPIFNNQENDVNLSYEEGFRTSIARISRAFEIVRENPDFMIAHMRQKIQVSKILFTDNGSGSLLPLLSSSKPKKDILSNTPSLIYTLRSTDGTILRP